MTNQISKISHKESTRQLMISLVKEDNLELATIEKNLTLSSAMSGTMLFKLEKTMVLKSLVKAISFVIMRGVQSYNVKGNINESQSVTIAIDLLEVYKFETIEDVVMLFKMARQGKFGDKIWKVDSSTIFTEWMPKYLEMKAIERENSHYNRKNMGIKLSSREIEIFKKAVKRKKQELKKRAKVAGNYKEWLHSLPEKAKHLSITDLEIQMNRANVPAFKDAFDIYENEFNNRDQTNNV